VSEHPGVFGHVGFFYARFSQQPPATGAFKVKQIVEKAVDKAEQVVKKVRE
jgi:hypothetical protein